MKKKHNIMLITIVSVLCILLIVGLFLFFKTDFFRTKRSAFLRYFKEIPEALNLLKEDEFANYKKKKNTTPYIRNANISILSSSNIADSSILDKIKLTILEKNDVQNGKTNTEISINNNQNVLERISLIRDKNVYGFYCEDITKGYVSIENSDLKRIAKSIGIEDVTYIPNEIKTFNIEKIFETTKVEKNKIQECLNIIKNDVPTTAYKKEGRKKIKLNNESYSTNAYSLTLNSEDSANLQIELLTKISQDSILMDYITSKCILLNFNEQYTNINSLNKLMKDRISELKQDNTKAESLTVIVYEYKQKNIRTEITYGNSKITINHLKENNYEVTSAKINNKTFLLQKDSDKYIIKYKDETENGFDLNIEYSQTGNLEDNDIKNKMTITKTSGIKTITYSYDDQMNFTNDIGKIDNFEGKAMVVVNNYQDEELKLFFNNLKKLINRVYVNKGASIGINLDPIFSM